MSVKNFIPKYVQIQPASGEIKDVTSITTLFQYYEDIDEAFVKASLQLVDGGENITRTLPIQGGEVVRIGMECNNNEGKKTDVEYIFRVWKIYDRLFDRNTQIYRIALVTDAAFVNEYQHVNKKLSGKGSEIVEDLLKNYLKVPSGRIFAEPTGNGHVLFPARRKPTNIIKDLQRRSISIKGYNNSKIANKQTKDSTKAKTEDDDNSTILKGSAGYMFYQNRNGFNFQSIDKLCDDGGAFDGNKVIAEYVSRPMGEANDPNNFNVIESYAFKTEIDLLDKMRKGVYTSKVILYNASNGKTEEYIYRLDQSFPTMAQLGSQSKLPKYATSDNDSGLLPPSRVISLVVDHETWNPNPSVADPDEGGTPQFPDTSKYTVVQSIARRYSLDFQKLEIRIPGNFELTVGEKIKVKLPNLVAGKNREKEPWDNESSGNYLIGKLSHNFLYANEQGQKFETVLELIRDTYGMKEDPSSIGND